MNTAQRILLRVLEHPANFINNNLAKRAGVLGRIGRFWSIGAREYGVHPSTKFLKYLNVKYLFFIKYYFARQSLSKTFFQKQNYINGYFFYFRLTHYVMGSLLLILPFVLLDLQYYERK